VLKGARKIIVKDELFYYQISGCIHVVIQRDSTGEKKKWFEEWKEKWGIQFTPKDVKELIINLYFKNNEL